MNAFERRSLSVVAGETTPIFANRSSRHALALKTPPRAVAAACCCPAPTRARYDECGVWPAGRDGTGEVEGQRLQRDSRALRIVT